MGGSVWKRAGFTLERIAQAYGTEIPKHQARLACHLIHSFLFTFIAKYVGLVSSTNAFLSCTLSRPCHFLGGRFPRLRAVFAEPHIDKYIHLLRFHEAFASLTYTYINVPASDKNPSQNTQLSPPPEASRRAIIGDCIECQSYMSVSLSRIEVKRGKTSIIEHNRYILRDLPCIFLTMV